MSLAHVAVPAALRSVNKIAIARYGVCILDLEPTAALWLADHVLATEGREVFGAIEGYRHRFGGYTPLPSIHSALWKAWSATLAARRAARETRKAS